ncbi:ubinuclein-1-like [Heliangelus exortis]|uniref:ubinuclein-1-like n=1 Tax=Heliangelus exortis TaxID=472823 RepID=UPI003A8CE192
MAKPRRVPLITLPAALSDTSSKILQKQEHSFQEKKTIRINIHLFEPDEKRCPEFFYPDLVESAQNEDSADHLNRNEKGEVEVHAKISEEKHGCRKRRREHIWSLSDLGHGYNESDSFIDDSDAYDPVLPPSLTTKYGGFYINTGPLEFRPASDAEEDTMEEKCPKKCKSVDGAEKLKQKRKKDEAKKPQKPKIATSGFMMIKKKKKQK